VYRDPRCVFVGESAAQAETVAAYLSGQGIAAEVIEPNTLGGLDGLNFFTGIGARGLEVWVHDPAAVPRARELLEAQAESLAQREARTGFVETECEECGARVKFPASEAGTVQDCPNCGAYLDVPDPDADGGDEDFGDDEPEAQHDGD
jgi:ribosomal protein S27E